MNITEIATAILPNVMEIIGTIAMFMAAKIGIPWLREQRIFSRSVSWSRAQRKPQRLARFPRPTSTLWSSGCSR